MIEAGLDDAKEEFLSQRRKAVDLISETRSRSVRVALFATLINRDDPDGVETVEDTAAQLNVLKDTARWITRVADMLDTGRDPWDEILKPVQVWLAATVTDWPETITSIRKMSDLSNQLVEAAENNPGTLGQALRDHYAFRRAGFMDAVTELSEGLWSKIGEERNTEMARARTTSDSVADALGQMEKIAKNVRLVSLNASVEAARVGEQGAGLGVIAVEFKRLAEEIQDLSRTARDDVSILKDMQSGGQNLNRTDIAGSRIN